MLRLDPDTRRTLLELATFSGLFALGLTVWQLSTSIPVAVSYVLLISCVHLLLRLRAQATQLVHTEERLREADRTVRELEKAKHLFKGMLGLFFFIGERPLSDTYHHFSYVQEEYIVHGDDGQYNWTLRGDNREQKPSDHLTIKISGDSPIDLDQLALSVLDELSGKELDSKYLRCIQDSPYFKTIEIQFNPMLDPGALFALRVSCRWDNTFARSRKDDYVFFPWGYYAAQGIDRLVGRLVVDRPVAEFALDRLDGGELIREHVQPRIAEAHATHYVLEWAATSPQHIYLLRFTKE